MQAAKMPGLAEEPQGESTKCRKTYGKIPPCLKTLHAGAAAVFRRSVGFLLNPEAAKSQSGHNGWNRSPMYSIPGWDSAERGLGQSHRLHGSVEFIDVNVGGSRGERCCPSMKLVSVGGVIVLGARGAP
jgi:hypothetical protein